MTLWVVLMFYCPQFEIQFDLLVKLFCRETFCFCCSFVLTVDVLIRASITL